MTTTATDGIVPKFIQIHFLAAWPGALLNRDDAGLAKRLPFGTATRTRVSSQCLKRHWRMADDPRALHELARQNGVEGVRSKQAIEREVTGPLRARFDKDMVDAVEEAFITKFYGKNAKDKQQRQALLFGRPELAWLREEAERLLAESGSAAGVKAAADVWVKEQKNNLNQLRDQNPVSYTHLDAADE